MSVITYEELALGWKPGNRSNSIFNVLVLIVLSVFIAAGIYISSVPVPKQKRQAVVPLPERIARFISEKPRPKPRPRPKVAPKPPPVLPPQFRRKRPEPVKPLTKVEKTARKKAENSGLLALTRQLSDLMDTRSIDKQVGKKLHQKTSQNHAAAVDSRILTADSGRNHVSVSQSLNGEGSGGGATLDNNQLQLAKKLLAAHGQIAKQRDASSNKHDSRSNRIRGDNLRSEEDVAYVMDRHKSMLHSLYRRARRTHPGLKGKIVLEITILPSGKVSRIHVVSSQLHDKALEQDLLSRIRLFDFGAKPVETLTLTIPVEFLPS